MNDAIPFGVKQSPGIAPVQFAYALGERVRIKGSGIEADIVGLIKTEDAEQYQIVWWVNCQRFTCAVFAREIMRS